MDYLKFAQNVIHFQTEYLSVYYLINDVPQIKSNKKSIHSQFIQLFFQPFSYIPLKYFCINCFLHTKN